MQVLADGLRVFVDDVFLGLAEHLNIKLGRCLLLFLYDLLKVLLPKTVTNVSHSADDDDVKQSLTV